MFAGLTLGERQTYLFYSIKFFTYANAQSGRYNFEKKFNESDVAADWRERVKKGF